MNIYVASSWRNEQQPVVVEALRNAGHTVYDFRQAPPEGSAFNWREVDPGWRSWDDDEYRRNLSHPVAQAGFKSDMDALRACEVCVLVLPCGRSAHLEAGWAAGAGKRLVILLAECEPELMNLMADRLCLTMDAVIGVLDEWEWLAVRV